MFYEHLNLFLSFRVWAETAIGVGIGDVIPRNDLSLFFQTLVMLTGAYLFSIYLIGQVFDRLQVDHYRKPQKQSNWLIIALVLFSLWLTIGSFYFILRKDYSFIQALSASISLICTNGTGIPPLTTYMDNFFIGLYIVLGVPLLNGCMAIVFFKQEKNLFVKWKKRELEGLVQTKMENIQTTLNQFIVLSALKEGKIQEHWVQHVTKRFNSADTDQNHSLTRNEWTPLLEGLS